MNERDKIISELRSLTEFVIEADNQIRDGNMVDLSRLDEEVGNLCDRTVALSAEDAQEVQPVMAEMINQLESLSLALQEYKAQASNNNEKE